MKKLQFVYPAVFLKDEEDGLFQVLFPDLNIYTDGKNMDDAQLNAKNLLKQYFGYAIKYDVDVNTPSDIQKMIEKCKPGETVMLIDAIVDI